MLTILLIILLFPLIDFVSFLMDAILEPQNPEETFEDKPFDYDEDTF